MLTFDFSEFIKKAEAIEGAARQVKWLLAVSLTNTMKEARAAQVAEMERSFDRPTPYTLKALQVVPATKANLRSEIRFEDGLGNKGTPADKFLGPEVHGGKRRHKAAERQLIRFGFMKSDEYVVPGKGVKLDSNGNIRPAIFMEILSALGAATDAMQNRTATSIKRDKARKKPRLKTFFVVRGKGAPPGVYMRKGKQAVPILMFVKGVDYRPRYPFYEVGRRIIPQAMRRHFDAAVKRYVIDDIKRRK